MLKLNYGLLITLFFAVLAVPFAASPSPPSRTNSTRQASKPSPAPANYQKLLTVADVESAASLKGLKLVPRDSTPGAGGDLNFAKADGTLLLMAQFGNGDLFKQWKAQPGFYGNAVTGVGDEAFSGPKGMAPYVLFLRKGSRSIGLSSFLDTDTMKPMLTQDQLRSIAKTILSRL